MDRSKPNATRWTLILRAQGAGPDARAALGELIRQYEGYILWLIRSHRHPPDVSPEDLEQSFLEGVLRRDDIARLDGERGSFRGWLRTAVKRFLLNEWDSWYAEKHGRSLTDVRAFDAYHAATPEDEVCDRAFACQLVRHVLGVMRAEAADVHVFDQLQRFLPGPQMDFMAQQPLALSLGMTTTALTRAIFEQRARFKELVRQAVSDTLVLDGDGSPAARARAEDAELAELRRSFREPERAGVVLEEA
jgi:DNA-directed RNA polymerase specialized sigma24 family protein